MPAKKKPRNASVEKNSSIELTTSLCEGKRGGTKGGNLKKVNNVSNKIFNNLFINILNIFY